MNKTGNNHSSLADSILKAAEKKVNVPNNNQDFAKQILESLKPQSSGPSLRETFAQLMLNNEPNDTIPTEVGPAEAGPIDEPGTDQESVKDFIAKALVELCGGLEQATQFLQECCSEPAPPMDDGMGMEGGMGMDADMGEAPLEPMPKPMPSSSSIGGGGLNSPLSM